VTVMVHDDPPLRACVEVLTATFAQEPAALQFCGPDARRRAEWFDALLRTQTGLSGRRLLATRDGRPVGVAVATAPGTRPRVSAQWSWSLRTLRGCGLRTLVGTVAYLRRTEPWKPAGAWTLEFVGVVPAARGEGLARRLCERAQADHPAAPAFLTTADPRNVALYERWGFGVSQRVLLAGLTVVGMTRRAPFSV